MSLFFNSKKARFQKYWNEIFLSLSFIFCLALPCPFQPQVLRLSARLLPCFWTNPYLLVVWSWQGEMWIINPWAWLDSESGPVDSIHTYTGFFFFHYPIMPSGLAWSGSNNINTMHTILPQIIIQSQSIRRVNQYLKTVVKSPRNVFSRWNTHIYGSSKILIVLPKRLLPFRCDLQRQNVISMLNPIIMIFIFKCLGKR